MSTIALPNGLTLRRTLPAEGGRIKGLAWSPDGRRLATAGGDPALRIWDLDGKGPTVVLGGGIPGWCVAWSPDGRTLAAGSTLDEAVAWDFESRLMTARLRHPGGVSTLIFARDGGGLLTGGRDGRIAVWDVAGASRRSELRGHGKAVTDLAWRPGADLLASASVDRSIRLWDLAGAKEAFALRGHEGAVLALAWSPNGEQLASAGADSSIRLWDCEKRTETRRLAGHTAAVVSVRFSPGGDLLVSKALDGTVRLWRTADWQTAAILEEPADDRTPFGSAVLHPRLPVLATLGAHDAEVRLWSVEAGALLSSPVTAALTARPPEIFDVFLCHNAADKPVVKRIGGLLKELGLRPWLDEWDLPPGLPWHEVVESHLSEVPAAAVFVGRSGLSPWQAREQKALLNQFVSRGCRVVPVLLPGVAAAPALPLFLQDFTWVDFRSRDPNPLERLVWGITGRRPDLDGPMAQRLAALSLSDPLA